MNKLNKKIISFVLLFSICLLVNVSYAFVKDEIITSTGTVTSNTPSTIGGINRTDIFEDAYNKYLYPDDTTIDLAFNQRIQQIYNSTDYNSYIMYTYTNSSEQLSFAIYFFNSSDVNVGIASYEETNRRFTFEISQKSTISSVRYNKNTDRVSAYTYTVSGGTYYLNIAFLHDIQYLNTPVDLPIYNLAYSSSQNAYYWDGSYYGTSSEEEPTTPTNAEIAQAVQSFYNSDYYKNNKDFKDFIVLLNTKTNTIDFIGHNFASQLAQCIVPANYEYDGESYNQDWWRFYLRGITDQINATLFEKYYWLYSTTDLGETINYNGKGYMNELLDLRFAIQSIIIYSTTDYFVQTFKQDDEGVYWPESGTISGDQYTYDENLDPTTNEYNPLENFVPTNPSQTILGDVDFDEINKTFEENKDILNIEGASWLFTANNKLVGYFIGFLSLLIVFLIISRILGG